MTVHAFLVTADFEHKMQMWAASLYANWIEGRGNGPGRETWQVMCMGEHAEGFLEAARQVGVTVEEIQGAGDDETYELRVGEPGTGWGGKP